MKMNDEVIQQIKDRTSITEVVSDYIDLDRNNMGLCPFHDDTNPSLSVKEDGAYFNCFGCGAGGDVITFLQMIKGISFIEAVERLAERCGMPVPTSSETDIEAARKQRDLKDVMREAARYYAGRLRDEDMRHLTQDRNFTEETISRFMIGYADGNLHRHLIDQKGYDPALCIESGLVKRTDAGYRDHFRDRLTFPFIVQGNVVNMTGRACGDAEPKYLHLPGSIDHLYNEDACRGKTVFIVEGPTDCLSLDQNGFPAVALVGRSLRTDHITKFSRCETVYICLDGDGQGRTAAIEIAESFGDRALIVSLPDGLDPNEFFTRSSLDDFDSLVDDAKDLMETRIISIPYDISSTRRVKLLTPIIDDLAILPKARAEAYVSSTMKDHFGLKKPEIDAYRCDINNRRKELSRQENIISEGEAHRQYNAILPGLVDIVLDEGETAFLMKVDDRLVIVPSVEIDGIEYIPPPKGKIPFHLVEGAPVLDAYQRYLDTPDQVDLINAKLFGDLAGYLRTVSELPSELHYPFIAAWSIHTYFQESINYSPILCLFAEPERGKTRTGLGIINTCYRGIHLESLREAFIFRASDGFRATLFFDVLDLWDKAERKDSKDLLLLRFHKGSKVPRVLFPDRGPYDDVEYYDNFGPTIIGTNVAVHSILETRAVQVSMPESRKRFDNEVTPETATDLKCRLLALRGYYLNHEFTPIPKPISGRLGDILRPIQQIIQLVAPQEEERFCEFVVKVEADRKLEKSESLEARILRAISNLRLSTPGPRLSVKAITAEVNQGQENKQKLFTNQTIGRKLRSLGFDKTRMNDGSSGIINYDDLLDILIEKYGLNITAEEESHEQQDVWDLAETPF